MKPLPVFLLLAVALHAVLNAGLQCADAVPDAPANTLRFATYNIEDIRTDELLGGESKRLVEAAQVIQRLRPDVLLINELAVDESGEAGLQGRLETNAQRFADLFLARSHGGSEPIKYSVFQPSTNTGVHSGFDLDNNGTIGTIDQPREYGNDSWGFGTFPGQYGMALFVRAGLEIDYENIRTYQHFRWGSLPNALVPRSTDGAPWYSEAEWAQFPLTSKNHAIVPVTTEDRRRIHVVISHPTPPAFDGAEARNKKRNHDEIRLIREIIDNSQVLVDDAGRPGGLAIDVPFVLMGDLNADPDEGSAVNNPVSTFLFSSPRVNSTFVPRATSSGNALRRAAQRNPATGRTLDRDDTAMFGLRVDYVLPSTDFDVIDGGVVADSLTLVASDHFPVWVDAALPDKFGE